MTEEKAPVSPGEESAETINRGFRALINSGFRMIRCKISNDYV